MSVNLKNGVVVFLMVCLTVPFTLNYLWFVIKKHEIRKEVKLKILSGMDRKELVLLSFTKTEAKKELRWEKESEFEYHNQMYDIVETEVCGDSIRYLCHWDKKETTLNLRIKELVAKALNQHPQNRESQKRLINYLQSLYFSDPFIWRPDIPEVHQELQTGFRWQCLSGFFTPLVPPPKLS